MLGVTPSNRSARGQQLIVYAVFAVCVDAHPLAKPQHMNQLRAFFSLILNRRMLLCGVLFYLLAACLGNIADVLSHQGPYVVTYGEDGEIVREVDRVTFLRNRLTMYGGLTLFMLAAWWFVSKYERDSALAKEADKIPRGESCNDGFLQAGDFGSD